MNEQKTTGTASKLAKLNSKESKPTMILRLIAQAESGIKCDVSLGDALEFRRDQYGMKKCHFAMLLGVTPAQYSEILAGKKGLSFNATKRAYALGLPADTLLQHIEPK